MGERVALTDAERDALVDAVGWHCSHVGPIVPSLPGGCRDCYEVVDHTVAGTVALIVAARMADAWDKGMEYGIGEWGAEVFASDYERNPHRSKETT